MRKLEPFCGDDLLGLRDYILDCLNRYFQSFPIVTASLFPEHEFSPVEASALRDLCIRIHKEGYKFFFVDDLPDSLLVALDNATEYGLFVDPSIGSSYLGLFVAAQAIMIPFAGDSFCQGMMDCPVYASASKKTQNMARILILLATFLRNKHGVDDYEAYLSRAVPGLLALEIGVE